MWRFILKEPLHIRDETHSNYAETSIYINKITTSSVIPPSISHHN